MSEATFTFRVDEALKSAFADAAKARDRTGAQLIRDFMRDYVAEQRTMLDHDRWFRDQVQYGLESAKCGRLISDDEVEADALEWRNATRRRLPGDR